MKILQKSIILPLILCALSTTDIFAMKRSADEAFKKELSHTNTALDAKIVDLTRDRVMLRFTQNLAKKKVKTIEAVPADIVTKAVLADTFYILPPNINIKLGRLEQNLTPIKYNCNRCNKVFPNKDHLNKHICTDREKQFSCTMCNRSFKHKNDLDKHTKNHKRETYKYECATCGKPFKYDKTLHNHPCS